MEKKKLEFLKAPIMATVVVARLMPGIPTYSNRFMFFLAVVLPFIPIFKFAEKFETETMLIAVFCYFIFYLVSNILLTQGIKKIGKQWSAEEYNLLKPDQITFPFILVLIVNAGVHFTLFYLISKCFT
tara:strand:+ start:91 stop:474 length:384 start_codon:yes stop_codon:yes gene_type:complete